MMRAASNGNDPGRATGPIMPDVTTPSRLVTPLVSPGASVHIDKSVFTSEGKVEAPRVWIEETLAKMRAFNEECHAQQESLMRGALEAYLGIPPLYVKGPLPFTVSRPILVEEDTPGVAHYGSATNSNSGLVYGSASGRSAPIAYQFAHVLSAKKQRLSMNGGGVGEENAVTVAEDALGPNGRVKFQDGPIPPPAECDEPPRPRKVDSKESIGNQSIGRNSADSRRRLRQAGKRLKAEKSHSTAAMAYDMAMTDAETVWLHDQISGKAKKQLGSKWFDLFMGGIIVVNTCVMFAQLEWEGRQSAAEYGFNAGSASYGSDQWGSFFDILEHVFTWIYIAELAYRLVLCRLQFFHDWTNLLDMFVVVITFLDVYIIGLLASSGAANDNLGVVKVLRLARMARALRFVRILKLFPSLRVLVRTIAVSVGSLIWSMVILFIFGLVGAMILCQTVQDFIADTSLPESTRRWVDDNYGTSTKAAWSVFELTMSGCWPNYSSVLIHDVSSWYAVFFALYVAVVVFAVIRIITALFLKDTLQVAASDAESIVASKMKQRMDYAKKLAAFFREADTSHDGTLSKEEFVQVLSNKKVAAYLSALEIEIHEIEALYQMLCDESGSISFPSFLTGVMRMKGQARSMDLISVSMDAKKILERCDSLVRILTETLEEEDFIMISTHPDGGMAKAEEPPEPASPWSSPASPPESPGTAPGADGNRA